MTTDFLQALNTPQRVSVEYCEGPQLIIAGAGSGKTQVLTYKIAYLIQQGINPHRILALTFTNKASGEMCKRIDNLLGFDASRSLWMGTFHSIFSKILHREAERLGYTKNYTIFDTSDSMSLLKQIIKEMNLTEDNYKPKNVFARISSLKNNLISAQAYSQNNELLEDDRISKREQFSEIYLKYTKRCHQSNAMDFDDLLLNTNILFKKFPDVLDTYRNYFDYILVDEFQDTNLAQYLIIKKLSEQHHKLCVVGDDAQSIYSFRGARIQNILNFQNDYPDCKLFKLEQNYRSTQTIVKAANSLIEKNKEQIHKKLFSEKDIGSKIRLEELPNEITEAWTIANIINRLCNDNNSSFSDCAILYRTNSQSRVFEDVLRKNRIAYKIYGGLSFYQRQEIKDIIAYIRLTINHNDIEAFRRIVNYPARKIGATTIERIFNCMEDTQVNLWDIISKPQSHNLNINLSTINRLHNFSSLIEYFSELANTTDAYTFILELLIKSGIKEDLLKEKTKEDIDRYENIQELVNAVKEFSDSDEANSDNNDNSIASYLERISILIDIEHKEDANSNHVSLMTVHAAKGLEYKNVFIVGVEENVFPHSFSSFSIQELEEERRLFYVAMTRAKENLTISYCNLRNRFGSTNNMLPSRFIKDIDKDTIDYSQINFLEDDDNLKNNKNQFTNKEPNFNYHQFENKTKATTNIATNTFASKNTKLVSVKDFKNNTNKNNTDISTFKIGDTVKHNSFGEGIVLEITIDGDNSKIIINFGGTSTKTLLLRYAKLEKI